MKRFLLFFVLFSCLPLSAAASGGKSPFTIADLYKVKRVEDPQVSPDGKSIAFVVSENHLKEGTTTSQIYVMNAAGSDVRQMTYGKNQNNNPRWSPDGQSLLFLSDRKDGAQVWILPAFGGEAYQVTSISGGASDPFWSADGKHIIFATDVFPECGANDSCNKEIDASMNAGPLHAHMVL